VFVADEFQPVIEPVRRGTAGLPLAALPKKAREGRVLGAVLVVTRRKRLTAGADGLGFHSLPHSDALRVSRHGGKPRSARAAENSKWKRKWKSNCTDASSARSSQSTLPTIVKGKFVEQKKGKH
jgi:hypothetical protein